VFLIFSTSLPSSILGSRSLRFWGYLQKSTRCWGQLALDFVVIVVFRGPFREGVGNRSWAVNNMEAERLAWCTVQYRMSKWNDVVLLARTVKQYFLSAASLSISPQQKDLIPRSLYII
jgi:hypothetical protein